VDGSDRVGDQALALAGYHSGTDKAEAALKNPRGNPKTYNHVRTILGPNFTRRWPRGQSAESRFTDLIDQMKTEKQSRAAETQLRRSNQPDEIRETLPSLAAAPEYESAPDPAAESDTTASGKDEAQPEEQLTNNHPKKHSCSNLFNTSCSPSLRTDSRGPIRRNETNSYWG
jgi:hypothetical protein